MNGDVISERGEDVRKGRIGENERVVRNVLKEEIMCAIKRLKGGYAAVVDGIVVEMLKNRALA